MKALTPKLILVPTDFGPPAAHALRYAAALGGRFGARLLVIYADSFIPPVDFTASAAGSFELPREKSIETAREQLQAFAEANIGGATPYDCRVMVGTPTDAIVALASEADVDLVVMGTHGRTGVRRLLLGSVTEAVMRLAPVPVIAVNESTPETARMQIVLGRTTHAPESLAALRYAATLVGDGNSRFVLCRAVDVADRPATVDDVKALDLLVPAELRQRSALRLIPSVEAADVVEMAREEGAELIVLGISGERGFADALLGTVVERVVQQSSCAVLTVNRRTARSLEADPLPRGLAISA